MLLKRVAGCPGVDGMNVGDASRPASSVGQQHSSAAVGDMGTGSGSSGVSSERVVCVDKSAVRARMHAVYAITAEGISVGTATFTT